MASPNLQNILIRKIQLLRIKANVCGKTPTFWTPTRIKAGDVRTKKDHPGLRIGLFHHSGSQCKVDGLRVQLPAGWAREAKSPQDLLNQVGGIFWGVFRVQGFKDLPYYSGNNCERHFFQCWLGDGFRCEIFRRRCLKMSLQEAVNFLEE